MGGFICHRCGGSYGIDEVCAPHCLPSFPLLQEYLRDAAPLLYSILSGACLTNMVGGGGCVEFSCQDVAPNLVKHCSLQKKRGVFASTPLFPLGIESKRAFAPLRGERHFRGAQTFSPGTQVNPQRSSVTL